MRMLVSSVLLLLAACETQPGRQHLGLVTDHGGPVLTHPTVYTIVWQGDEAVGASVDALHAAVMATPTVWGTLAQYGVEEGRAGGAFVVPGPAPSKIEDESIPSMLQTFIDEGLVPGQDASPDPIYAIVPPASTMSFQGSYAGCDSSCDGGGFFGYHGGAAGGFVYAIDLRCNGATQLDDELATIASHELGEAATDPYVKDAPAWYFYDEGGEVADLCGYRPSVTTSLGETHRVASYWSNRVADSPHGDPCSPDPYFNVWLPDTVNARADGTFSFELIPYADPGVGEISYAVYGDCALGTQLALHGSGAPPTALLEGSAHVGQHVHVDGSAAPLSNPTFGHVVPIYVLTTRGTDVNVWSTYVFPPN